MKAQGVKKEKEKIDGTGRSTRNGLAVILYKKMDGNPKKGGRLGGIDDDEMK